MLGRLLEAIGFRKYRSSLEFVSGPTRVRLSGTVASDNVIQSPASGTQAAWMSYVLGTVESYYDHEQGRTIEIAKEVARHSVAAAMTMQTDSGLVRIPAEVYRVQPAGEALSARTPLSTNPPPELHAAIAAQQGGALIYGEQYLRKDDEVELQATVGPSGDPNVPWTVIPGEDALLIDRSLEALGL